MDVVKQFVTELKPKATHLFKGNTGGSESSGTRTATLQCVVVNAVEP
jgi:hypothetical protein